ncbi:MAG: futalosine hydrolase, partial [Actinobacteria bacterium]
MILVVAATQRELDGAGGAETLACGIGPVEAAAATASALASRRPDALLHVGIAGASGL